MKTIYIDVAGRVHSLSRESVNSAPTPSCNQRHPMISMPTGESDDIFAPTSHVEDIRC